MPIKDKTVTNLFLDIAVFLAFILAMMPRITGIPVHELLSVAFAACVVAHLLLHWEWIVGVAPKFFARLFQESRLNFLVDSVLFLAMIVIMVSGFALSKFALPALGITLPFSPVWKRVHGIAAEAALIALGIHGGLHARWIALSGKKHIIEPIIRLVQKRTAKPAAVEVK